MDLARGNCNSFNYANYTRCNIGENIEIRGVSQLKKSRRIYSTVLISIYTERSSSDLTKEPETFYIAGNRMLVN